MTISITDKFNADIEVIYDVLELHCNLPAGSLRAVADKKREAAAEIFKLIREGEGLQV